MAKDAIRVFLSYTRADRPRVEPVVALLRAAGFELWWDSDLRSGAAFARETEAALTAADVVIVAWSTGAVQSDWVRDEAGHGRDRGRLLPLRLDDVQAPLGFRQLQWIDLIGWDGRADAPAARRLVTAVVDLAARPGPERPPQPVAANPTPDTSLTRPGRRAVLLGGAGVAMLGIGAITVPRWLTAAGPAPNPAAPISVTPIRHSIAVLPFTNLSGAADQDYFADGLTEELQARLGRFGGLDVAGRTSSFRFRERRQAPAVMAGELGVAFLVDGGVRRAGDRVRVTAELVEAASGLRRWGATYDRRIKDIFAVQTEIAGAVAAALHVTLLGGGGDPGGTADPAALDEYLRGTALLTAFAGAAGLRAALVRFDAALAADPRFARAHAARARTLIGLANQFLPLSERPAAYAAALDTARLAVDIAPGLAEAQTTQALALIEARRDFAGAGQAFARALAAGPPDVGTLYRHGVYLLRIGRAAAALQSLGQAVARDPLNATSWTAQARALMRVGRWDDAVAAGRRAIAVSPGISGAHAVVAKALYLSGAASEALAAYGREPEGWERLTGEAIVKQRLGDTAGARAALAMLIRRDGDTIWYQRAQIAAQWGDKDAAFAALARALALGDAGTSDILLDPFMDPLASDPRFKNSVAALGLGLPGRAV